MKSFITLAALAAATLVAPAFAQDRTNFAQDGETGTGPRVVSYADLDLKTHSGVKKLDRRIDRAVRDACGWASDLDVEGKNEMLRCRQQTIAGLSAQRNRAIDGAQSPQLALNQAPR